MNIKQLTDKIKALQSIESDNLDKEKFKKIIIDVDISEEGSYITHEWYMNGNHYPTHKKRRPLKMLDDLIKYEGSKLKN